MKTRTLQSISKVLTGIFVLGTFQTLNAQTQASSPNQLQSGKAVPVNISGVSTTSTFSPASIIGPPTATFLFPGNPGSIPEFSKAEIGVNIPSIAGEIATFLNDPNGTYKPGTTAYNTANINQQIINPYDPQQVTVDWVLYRPGTTTNPIIRHGFYYLPVTNTGSDWTVNASNNPYPWRIRFAPDQLGTWTGYVSYSLAGLSSQTIQSISFTVVASWNPGFIQKGPNPNYLQYSGSGATYTPIGNNYAWPYSRSEGIFTKCMTQNCNLGVAPASTITPNQMDCRITPSAVTELNNFISVLTQNTVSSANTTRLIMEPFSFQIEFEKLGNYDTRQIEMSVLDDYINLLEQNNIKLILGQLGADLSYMGGYLNPAVCSSKWDGNPYNGSISSTSWPNAQFKGIQGINTIYDLLDPNNPAYNLVLQLYKNRWRYIESRWGYSTAISQYELLTEVDQISLQANPNPSVYWFPTAATPYSPSMPNLETNMSGFLGSIAKYLKSDLATKHLTTVSYVGDPDPFKLGTSACSPVENSQIFSSPYIDIVTAHMYGLREANSRINTSNIQAAKSKFPGKPIYVNECDAMNWYDVISLCSDLPTHNLIWSSVFSGAMGPGLPWSQMRYAIQWYSTTTFPFNLYAPAQPDPLYSTNPNSYSGEYEKNFTAFNKFTSLINFKTLTYNYYYSPMLPIMSAPPQPHELFYMVDNSKQVAYGWAHNRSFTTTNNTPCFNNLGHYSNMGNFRDNPSPNDVGTATTEFLDNAPQTLTASGGHFCNEDYFNNIFGAGFYPMALGTTAAKVGNLLPNTLYTTSWYWTWGSSGGQINSAYTATTTTDASGNLPISIPPTGPVSKTSLYPGDWAFIINKYTGIRGPNTGMEEMELPKLVVSPNPSSDLFYISATEGPVHEKATLQLFDITGKLLLNETVPDVDHYAVDLKDKVNGIYILKVTINNQLSVLRLSKTN